MWSAIKQRKESEERLKCAKNRIKKLELDKSKLVENLEQLSRKSKKLAECQQWHQSVFLN